MTQQNSTEQRPIKIAILALGGQGGGVLSGWILEVFERSGFLAQATSVPGVAQRTGATIYYVEAFPKAAAEGAGAEPILALMPTPDDVDIVIAAELMEAGRAVLRGFVSPEVTTAIVSTHRVYAIGEKSRLGDGRARADRVLAAVQRNAKKLIGFDMQKMADEAGAVISAPLFGALAGAGVVPIERAMFEETIRAGGVAVAENLEAFAAAFNAASKPSSINLQTEELASTQTPPAFASLSAILPAKIASIASEGARRCSDYQNRTYAKLYVDRVMRIWEQGGKNAPDAAEAATRHLAVWMTYEDAIRVADLKTRRARFHRVCEEAGAGPGDIVRISEFLRPRVEEICDIMPAPFGRLVLNNKALRGLVGAFFGGGRRIRTTTVFGFIQLHFLSGLRPIRPWSLRYLETQSDIEDWIELLLDELGRDPMLALQIAEAPRLLKGYGDTYARGRDRYAQVLDALSAVKREARPAEMMKRLIDSALADDEGKALSAVLQNLSLDKRTVRFHR
ncbi:MAG: indolepyruvate oxidoreductase subunit beta family protein [Alphaproteobacteria bacterium]|nr:indolepyruvate oxidoreductase subunit beta family protein [Alphaproteobacteria bacterium]